MKSGEEGAGDRTRGHQVVMDVPGVLVIAPIPGDQPGCPGGALDTSESIPCLLARRLSHPVTATAFGNLFGGGPAGGRDGAGRGLAGDSRRQSATHVY